MNCEEIRKKLVDRYINGDDLSREVLELLHVQGMKICKQNLRIQNLEEQIAQNARQKEGEK